MNSRQSIGHKMVTDVAVLLATQKRSDLLLFIVVFVTVFSLTPLLVLAGAAIGFSMVFAVLVALTIAALVVKWPLAGLFMITGCVVLIEQDPLEIHILTDQLNVYYWPRNLAGLIERPIGFLIIFIILMFVCHRLVKRQQFMQGGELLGPFLFYLLCIAGGVVHGLTSGGDFKIIVLEIRPFWYMFVSYLLAYNLVTHKKHIRAFLWMVILGAGVKAVQGTYIYLIVLHGNLEGYHQIMSHEESFFFVALILLVALFCLHYRYRPQLYTALLILPCLLIALIANQRRTDYIALLVGLVIAWTLIFWVNPHIRLRLAIGMLVCVAIGAGYIAAFSHSSGAFASPARAVMSIINPATADTNDANSNLYRLIENYDLKYTAKQNLLGWGFGKKFLQPVQLTDLSSGDPDFGGNPYLYIPHNTIYWIWMRLGPIGYMSLWYLLGSIIVRGCLAARRLKDPYLQLVAIYIVAITFMEVIVAFADYQLFFYRNVIYIGLLVGILMKLSVLEKEKKVLPHETTHGVSLPSVPNLGS